MAASHNSLILVRQLIERGSYRINGNAVEGALNDFGWGETEILDCIMRLDDGHRYKSEPHRVMRGCIQDFYRAPDIMDGESVYTHFYVTSDLQTLVVNSFKEL